MPKLDFDPERDVPELTGKVLLITGGTNGLRAAAAKMLARRNPAKIYITFCLGEKLEARLWDWTEEELKPWLA